MNSSGDSLQRDREFALAIVRRLRDAGYEALWAGGCVRDLLMGNAAADYDVATSATPAQVRKLFGHRHTLPVGVAFGVVIVLDELRAAQQVEVATFRTESSYSDGRRPDRVEFSTAEKDAQRRDFTINGMFYDPVAERVIDYVGGREDLERRLVRAIGDAEERIGEDKLRMLRAIRFAARFGFSVAPDTLTAIGRHSAELKMVSGERMAVEVAKTLVTDAAAWAVHYWAETKLLDVCFPELIPLWEHPSERVEQMLRVPLMDWRVRLAAMLWESCEASKFDGTVDSIRERLKLSNDDTAALRFALQSQERLAEAEQLAWSDVQPLLVNEHACVAVDLLELRCAIGEASQHTVAWLRERLAWAPQELNPPPVLEGQDLIEAGLKPSPQFRDILTRARAMQLDGQLSTRESAIEWLRDLGNA